MLLVSTRDFRIKLSMILLFPHVCHSCQIMFDFSTQILVLLNAFVSVMKPNTETRGAVEARIKGKSNEKCETL